MAPGSLPGSWVGMGEVRGSGLGKGKNRGVLRGGSWEETSSVSHVRDLPAKLPSQPCYPAPPGG